MFTLDLDRFMFELKDGALKHVGSSTKSATAKLYDVTEIEARAFGDDRVKITCADESGNEIEVALDTGEAAALSSELDRLESETDLFE